MPDYYAFMPPALALLIIIRRGSKPQRVKPSRLWVFPGIIAILAVSSIWKGQSPDLIAWAVYAAAVAAGGVFGWFTTQHIELTLDDKTGTVMSQPSLMATAVTAAVFIARFLVDYANGGHGSSAWKDFAVAHGASLTLITAAGLLFVAARGLSRAWHMMARINPMLAAHKAGKGTE